MRATILDNILLVPSRCPPFNEPIRGQQYRLDGNNGLAISGRRLPGRHSRMSPCRKAATVLLLSAVALFSAIPGFAMNPEELATTRQAAENGSASAQVLLAIACLNGDAGLVKDAKLAAQWFERAALQGNGYAEGRLADLYADGTGVAKNLKIAADWRERAARRGNVEAQFKLGQMYLEGSGVAQDRERARELLQSAAEDGHREAAYLLARMYSEGLGGPEDQAMADHWLYKSALRGYGAAEELLGWIRSFGHTYDKTVSHEAVRRLAEDGDAEAQYQLGLRCYLGKGGEKRDLAQAVTWFERAAGQGQVMAMRNLAQILARGENGVPADPQAAKAWLERAGKARP
ncbi:MAG: sel1 repeat family protein [Rhodocyclaceae bacterium]|nr:MAG: sel1 repeat family protein [Rhodocyclaceae bacterium]